MASSSGTALSTAEEIPFGKHRGKPITEVPFEYLVWLAGFEFNGKHKDMRRQRTSATVLDDIIQCFWENCYPRDDGTHAFEDKGGNRHQAESRADVEAWVHSEILVNPHLFYFGKANTYRAYLYVEDNYPEWPDLAEDELVRRKCCLHCGRRLMPIGYSRSNGKEHADWDGRMLHKKCWKELCEDYECWD